ncbi:MAG TPA: sigma-70 family RNA polymerase sigma factor [Thermoanaerobaculia bacterium]|nr:sigma-70 family RNA polymerase sigma factor [Thermoanaerobaculia bacterium]
MNAQPGRSDDTQAEAETLFRANLALIDRVVDRVCHNANIRDADAEDFASTVKLALIENDYAVLRAWQRRASLTGYLLVVVQRMLSDERSRTRGRFEPSAEARRGGKAAILLETLVRRDGRPVEQALPLVQAVDPSFTRAGAEALLARLPERVPRPRPAPIDDVDVESPRASDGAEAAVADRETERLSAEASRVVRQALASLPQEDRTIVRMHFGSGTSIADISRMLRLPQRPLYRRIESVLAHLRKALQSAGIDAGTAGDLIGSAVQALDFGIANGKNGFVPQSQGSEGPENRV